MKGPASMTGKGNKPAKVNAKGAITQKIVGAISEARMEQGAKFKHGPQPASSNTGSDKDLGGSKQKKSKGKGY